MKSKNANCFHAMQRAANLPYEKQTRRWNQLFVDANGDVAGQVFGRNETAYRLFLERNGVSETAAADAALFRDPIEEYYYDLFNLRAP